MQTKYVKIYCILIAGPGQRGVVLQSAETNVAEGHTVKFSRAGGVLPARDRQNRVFATFVPLTYVLFFSHIHLRF